MKLSAIVFFWFLLIGMKHECDDPKAYVEIDGVGYGGRLKVTRVEIEYLNDLYKQFLNDKSLPTEQRERKINYINERLGHVYARMRYCEQFVLISREKIEN